MYGLFRPLLFRLDAERAHNLMLALLRFAGNLSITDYVLGRMFQFDDPRLEVEAFGIRFKNPIGLAAGYDKNGIAVRGLSRLGFGHIEIGTVTRFAQAGNPHPRIHRLPESGALINSMGFPNAGVDALTSPRSPLLVGAGVVKYRRRSTTDLNNHPSKAMVDERVRLGINIGKSTDTSLERAAEDYSKLLKCVHAQADYVALNVSSPNTPGLRDLQSRAVISDLLRTMTRVRDELTPRTPLLVKISPDLSPFEMDDILDAVRGWGVDGVIATNTTLGRATVSRSNIPGGLSGAPLRVRATEVIRYIAQKTRGALPIIGVGGIFSAADALEKLRAGARLVQVYTGLVYKGPGLVRQINRELVRACERDGVKNIGELSQK